MFLFFFGCFLEGSSWGEVGIEFRCQLTEPYQIGYRMTEVRLTGHVNTVSLDGTPIKDATLRFSSVAREGRENELSCNILSFQLLRKLWTNNFNFPIGKYIPEKNKEF